MKITLLSESAATKRSSGTSKESHDALKQYNTIVKNMQDIQSKLDKVMSMKAGEDKDKKRSDLNDAMRKADLARSKLLAALKRKGIPLPRKGRLLFSAQKTKQAGPTGKSIDAKTAKSTLEKLFKGAKVTEKDGKLHVKVSGSKQTVDLIPMSEGKYKVAFNANVDVDKQDNSGYTVVTNPSQLTEYLENKLEGF